MKISNNTAEGMLNLHIWKQFIFLLNILCEQQFKKDVSKSDATATGTTIEDEYLIKVD